MASWTRPPHPALAGFVADYVGYLDRPDPRAVHHGLPSPTVTVILAFEAPLDAGWLATRATDRFWAMAGGLHLRPALVRTHGLQCGLQLALTPPGCRALLGVPASALAGRLVDLHDLGWPRDAHARLADAPSWSRRFDLLDALLLRALDRRRPPVAADVAQAWRVASAGFGRRRVGAVARAVGRSERWLSKHFAAEFGVTPQQAGRLHRFDGAVALARHGLPLADAAASAGYADQAHLSREWKELAGLTPRQLLGEPYRLLQDPGGAPG